MEAAHRRLKGHFFKLLVFVTVFSSSISAEPGFVGVNLKYPISKANLPRAEHLVDLLKIIEIQRVKLQGETHPSLLRALAGSGIQVLLTIPDAQDVESVSESLECASRWLASNVVQHLPGTAITGVVVGDEFSIKNSTPILVRAMRNLHASLQRFNLDNVKISAAVAMNVLVTARSTWPSSASVKAELQESAAEVLEFLSSTGSFFTVNVDPIEVHQKENVPALLSPTNQDGFFDGDAQLTYTSRLDSLLDSISVSMEKLGFSKVPVVLGSISWPLSISSAAATESTALFQENLVKRILSNQRPSSIISAYVSELIDATDIGSGLGAADLGRRFLADGTNASITPPASGSGSFCVAKQGTSDNDLSVGLNWACGQGNVDCSPIMQNGPCFTPDTYSWHASYAFNAYYQKNVAAGGTCSFGGAAELTNVDPSTGSCSFTGSAGGGSISPGGAGAPGGSTVGSTNGVITPTNPNSPSAAGTFHFKVCALQALVMALVVWRL